MKTEWQKYEYSEDDYSRCGRYDYRAIKVKLPNGWNLDFVRYIDEDLSVDDLMRVEVYLNNHYMTSYPIKHKSDREANKAIKKFLKDVKCCNIALQDFFKETERSGK